MSERTVVGDGLHVAIDCLVVAARPSGVERAVVGLVQGLARLRPSGRRFSLLVTAGREDVLPTGPEMALLAAPGWTRGRIGRVLYEQTLASARVRSAGAHVLHGPAYVLPLAWEGPSVLTIYDAITLSRPEWCQWHNVVHYGIVMTRSAYCADAIVAPSEWTKQELVEYLGVDAGRVHVCPLGVDEQFRPAAEDEVARVRTTYGLPEKYLLCVGNVEPRKNLEAVIAAFELVAPRLPHGLVIAGKRGWKCRPICRAMQTSSHAARIHWLDWVPHEDLPPLYTGAHVLIQFSLHEGFGLTPLEAMACGTPAIISDGGALPEVSGEAAAVVPLEAGAEGLAAEIMRLATDDAMCEALVARGFTHAGRYTWERHARGVLKVYEEVARV